MASKTLEAAVGYHQTKRNAALVVAEANTWASLEISEAMDHDFSFKDILVHRAAF